MSLNITENITATWHKESFDRFLWERLPQLLADTLPLAGYNVEPVDRYTCHIKITLPAPTGGLDMTEIIYDDIPLPDEDGVFLIEGKPRVVVPLAANENLDTAPIACVGEQLYQYIEERCGTMPQEVALTGETIHAWLPLDAWIQAFFASHSQLLDTGNWLAKQQHLRRIFIKECEKVIAPGQFGRTCPFETPEGPNIGRYLVIAVGATIRDGKLIIVDERPEASLGLGAAMIPFLEYDEPGKLLMGTNMLRQWMVPPDPEPAYVQSGNEPVVADFWCGRNLLTAFVSWGRNTFENGIIISESCARRLSYPHPVEPGDKLSNRHGVKGEVSCILPDDEMPHLADGTPVELVYSFISLHRRLYFGQLREAVLGRIVHTTGIPAIVPPFHAPDAGLLKRQLQEAGLPQDGMEMLTSGRDSVQLQQPSTVGPVYWGRLYHTAASKIRATTSGSSGQKQVEQGYVALRNASAYENILEQFNTCSAERPDAATLAARVASGPVAQATAPAPQFAELMRRLAVAGIRAVLTDGKLTFSFAPPEGSVLKLAQPLAHPWLRERMLSEVGVVADIPQYRTLVEANTRMERILSSHAPESLAQKARTNLETRLYEFFEALLTPSQLLFYSIVLFSGRAVLVPGADLGIDQVGIGNDIAWELFGPLVVRELGDEEEVRIRGERATEILDTIMARSWIIIYRSPALTPTAFLAFHPVRYADKVIRLHPLTCAWLNVDFDGDQAAVFLPVTQAAQREAGERLSVAGHLQRDSGLLRSLLPGNEAMWGLASLSLTAQGRKEIAELLEIQGGLPDGLLTKTSLLDIMNDILRQQGVRQTLTILEQLARRGFAVTKASGASMNPFIGESVQHPAEPRTNDFRQWMEYAEVLAERIASRTDFTSADIGPQLLAIKSEAIGSMRLLAMLIGSRGAVMNGHGEYVLVRHGVSEGLTPEEMYALVPGTREALARLAFEWEQTGKTGQTGKIASERSERKGFSVLLRAMRSDAPGVVFANAAASGEVDELRDMDSRLFVGLATTEKM
ncbi:MAG: hypothetical protein ABI406_09265 [Ktedonobacteraceae bacterium]